MSLRAIALLTLCCLATCPGQSTQSKRRETWMRRNLSRGRTPGDELQQRSQLGVLRPRSSEAKPYDQNSESSIDRAARDFYRRSGWRESGSGITGAAERSVRQHGQLAALPGKTRWAPRKLRASGNRGCRERQDQGDVFVVPASGTGELSGLRGEGGFEGDFGKGSDGWLDYWFDE